METTLFTPPALDALPRHNLWLAADRLLLSAAIDLMGKTRFPRDWSGKEVIARRIINEPSGPRRVDIPPGSLAGPRFGPAQQYWLVETVAGIRRCDELDAASEVWGEERAAVIKLYGDEIGARRRFTTVSSELRQILISGQLPSYLHDRCSGLEQAIPKYFWKSDAATRVFENEDRPARWENPNVAIVPSLNAAGNVVLPTSLLEGLTQATANTIAAETRCKGWLEGLMRSSAEPVQPKPDYFKEAVAKFPGLPKRAFDRAWATAVAATGAVDWAKAGKKPAR